MSNESKAEYPMGELTPNYTGAPAYTIQNGYQQNLPPNQVPAPHEVEYNEDTPEDEDKRRGPGNIPQELNLDFEECFFESKGTQTVPQIYTFTALMYKHTKFVVYHIFVILFGILFALIWAIINGLMAFIHSWIYSPALKLTVFWVYAISPLVTAPLQVIWTPLVDSTGRIFRQIQVKASLDGSFAQRLATQGQIHTA